MGQSYKAWLICMAFLLTAARSVPAPCFIAWFFEIIALLGVSVLGDTQRLRGHAPGQPAHALSRRWEVNGGGPAGKHRVGGTVQGLGTGFQKIPQAPVFLQSF